MYVQFMCKSLCITNRCDCGTSDAKFIVGNTVSKKRTGVIVCAFSFAFSIVNSCIKHMLNRLLFDLELSFFSHSTEPVSYSTDAVHFQIRFIISNTFPSSLTPKLCIRFLVQLKQFVSSKLTIRTQINSHD
ncbi:hypothetical protein GGGNBK_05165 [Sporosarcina sp. ANT_H38]